MALNRIWLSPNKVPHTIDARGRCLTCGRLHDPKEFRDDR